ncbi:unnamed protein product [Symbiodinium microadriaticum]|nr:unnamed protein product [Symbiodinium microadriaticum]
MSARAVQDLSYKVRGAGSELALRSPGTESAVTVSLGAAVRPPGVPQDGWRERPIADPHGGVSLVLQRSTAVAFLRQLAQALARESPARMRPAVQRASLQSRNATARSHLSVTCSRMLVAPSHCPRVEFRLRVVHPSTRRRVHRALLAGGELERYDERNQLLADAASVVARVNMEQGLKLNWTA